ncbi:hypothetical protein E2C01_098695 [Portunus trituberculatus]|uniref:Uncharacterized protein n=1 Tax=Portunus trituberculatus TaxID=210409 RepID=A0A5B7KCR5_PORTR|nr:hypothetical protein [Portunus trituberculatus]
MLPHHDAFAAILVTMGAKGVIVLDGDILLPLEIMGLVLTRVEGGVC